MSDDGGAGRGAQQLEYNFVALDYVVVAVVLAVTAIIGFYHVWMSRTSKSTREFLVANTGVSTWALILSAAATNMSPGSVLGLPMESYSNGVQMVIYNVASTLGVTLAAYGTVPVLYNLNVNTVNQYMEYRFNRFLRIFPAVMCLLQNSVVAAAITYVTALVLAQATGFSLWLSIFLIAGLCIVYSSLGGFTAVIWTDVFQMLVIFGAYVTMLVKGTMDSGGIANIWKQNELGERTLFHWKPSPFSNYTVWSLVIGNFTIGFLSMATDQSSLQRQIANRSLARAKRTAMNTTFITKGLNLMSVWIGMSIYAKYRDCDLYTAKRIESRDQVTATFAMDIFNDIPGMSGLFVGGMLCATLSTLSSIINAFVTVSLTDLVKPLMPTLSDKKTRILSKVIGGLYGLLIFGFTGYGRHFGGIIQTLQSVRGTSIGSMAIIFILGFFFPWATTKGATIGYFVSLVFGSWLSLQYMMSGSPYATAPMSTRGCSINATDGGLLLEDYGSSFFMSNLTSTTFAPELASSYISADDSLFSVIGLIAPIWFSFLTMTLGLTIGIAVSIFTGSIEKVGTVEANLISPFTKGILRQLPTSVCKQLGVTHLILSPEKSKFPMALNRNDNPHFGVEHELVLLNKQGIATDDKDRPTISNPE